MNRKSIVMLGAVVGSTIGGLIPAVWGSGEFSMISILLAGIGGLGGIWLAFRITS